MILSGNFTENFESFYEPLSKVGITRYFGI